MARVATFNVQECFFHDDLCHTLAQNPLAGENVAEFFTFPGYYSSAEVIQMSIDGWFSEYNYANMDIIRSYPEGTFE